MVRQKLKRALDRLLGLFQLRSQSIPEGVVESNARFGAVIPDRTHAIFSVDCASIELRVAAQLAQQADDAMRSLSGLNDAVSRVGPSARELSESLRSISVNIPPRVPGGSIRGGHSQYGPYPTRASLEEESDEAVQEDGSVRRSRRVVKSDRSVGEPVLQGGARRKFVSPD